MKLPLLSLASPSGCYQILGQKWLGKERSDFGPSSLGLSLWWAKALLINQQRKLQLHYNPLPCQKQISNNESTANLGNVIRDRKRVLWSRMGWRIPKWKWVWWENLSFSITGSWKTAHHVYQGFGLTQWVFESFDTVTDLTSCAFREETEPHELQKWMFKTGMDCRETYHRSTARRSTAQHVLHTLAIHLRSWTFQLRSFMLHKYAFWGWLDGQKYKMVI